MAPSKPKTSRAKPGSSKSIEKLLSAQTTVILHAVDERLTTQDKKFETRFNVMDRRFDAIDRRFDVVDKRFDKLEQRFMEKLNSLTHARSLP